ncbi:MAG: hypothetical protein QF745_04205, partial [Planctomycetota bacterium]|nr:hypothetical protein [Planctomycetota bacterium]
VALFGEDMGASVVALFHIAGMTIAAMSGNRDYCRKWTSSILRQGEHNLDASVWGAVDLHLMKDIFAPVFRGLGLRVQWISGIG